MIKNSTITNIHEPIYWKGEDIHLADCTYLLTDALIEEFKTLVPYFANSAPSYTEILAGSLLEEFLFKCKNDVENKNGFCIIEGLDKLVFTTEGYQNLSLLIGNVLGTSISQNKKGEHLVMVTDEGKSTTVPTHRGHKTSDELGFHNDRCDLILLVCIQQAPIGGESYLVSCKYVHDYILTHAPHHLEILYGLFPNHRRGEEREGEHPWCLLPIFSAETGQFVCRFVKRFIMDSQLFEDAPKLTEQQLDALEYMEQVINREEVKFSFKLNPGQAILINNHTLLHARGKYEDDPSSKRSLARVWLSYPESRALPEFFRPLYREVKAGAVRGGI